MSKVEAAGCKTQGHCWRVHDVTFWQLERPLVCQQEAISVAGMIYLILFDMRNPTLILKAG